MAAFIHRGTVNAEESFQQIHQLIKEILCRNLNSGTFIEQNLKLIQSLHGGTIEFLCFSLPHMYEQLKMTNSRHYDLFHV